jgi:plastocyanin
MRGTAIISLMTLAVLAEPAGAATSDVAVSGNAFTPAQVNILQGDVVTWTWGGPDTNHSTTTEAEGQTTWDSDARNPNPDHAVGDKFSREFQIPGEFDYFCKVHAFMTGRVIVTARDPAVSVAPDIVAPAFGPLRVDVKRRRVRFNLDEAATMQAALRGPTRHSLVQAGQVGPNVIVLPKRLRAGRYALTLRATDAAGNESTPAVVKFRVPKPKRRR